MQFTESFIDTVNAAWANKNGHTVNVSKYACTDTHRPFHLCVALTMRFERCLSHSLNSFIFNKFFFLCELIKRSLLHSTHHHLVLQVWTKKKQQQTMEFWSKMTVTPLLQVLFFQTTKDRYIERNETHTWRNNSVGFFFSVFTLELTQLFQ